jgi:hypothetical protein
MGGQNINSTFFSFCAVEFGTNIFSALKIVWLLINFFPSLLIYIWSMTINTDQEHIILMEWNAEI